jgi:hypothetical protein
MIRPTCMSVPNLMIASGYRAPLGHRFIRSLDMIIPPASFLNYSGLCH